VAAHIPVLVRSLNPQVGRQTYGYFPSFVASPSANIKFIDWGLTAFTAQIGYIVPLKRTL